MKVYLVYDYCLRNRQDFLVDGFTTRELAEKYIDILYNQESTPDPYHCYSIDEVEIYDTVL